jgi:uncharacterized OB-fold protein
MSDRAPGVPASSESGRTGRPLPDVDSAGAPFWAAAREHRLVVQHCSRCGRLQHFPRAFCTNCMNDELEFVPARGSGTVYSFTVIRRNPNPAFADRVPYVYALVDLDEGVRITTNIVGCAPDDVHIGQRVRVAFEDVDDEHTVPLFTPADGV